MKKIKGLSLLMLVLLLALFVVGCSQEGSKEENASSDNAEESTEGASEEGSSEGFVKAEDIEAPLGKHLLGLPADVVPEEEIRIAAIMVQNNPFGMAVKEGADFAKEVLKDRNTTVEWISVPDFDPKKFEEAVQNAVTAQYDAFTIFGASDALRPAIKQATEAGLDAYTFNTDVEDSDRVAYWGQDGYEGGKKLGEILTEQLDGEGEYAIITGDFSVLGHEQRRTGARDVIDEVSGMKLVGEYENNDKAEEAYNIVQNLLVSNPNLKGIYVTAGGPFGAAKALKDAGKEPGEIKLVAHDWLEETVDYTREGYITAVLDQDPFNQGYVPVIAAFNKIAAGEEPEEQNWFEGDIATPENVSEKIPE